MENGPKRELSKAEIMDKELRCFGESLSTGKNTLNKSDREIAIEIGVAESVFSKWRNGGGFPDESKLERIAEVLKIDINKLREDFRISKNAREREKESRLGPRYKPRDFYETGLPSRSRKGEISKHR